MSNLELMSKKLFEASNFQKAGRIEDAINLLQEVVEESTDPVARFMAARELYIVFARANNPLYLEKGSRENRDLLKYVQIVIGAYPHMHPNLQKQTDIANLRQLHDLFKEDTHPPGSTLRHTPFQRSGPVTRNTDVDKEFAIFENLAEEMDAISTQFSQADTYSVQNLHRLYQERLFVMEELVKRAKSQFPNEEPVRMMEAFFLVNCGRLKLQNNDTNASLDFLNRSIAVFDMAMTRIVRASLYSGMNQRELALQDLNHIIAHPPSDQNLYHDAIQMKRELASSTGGGVRSIGLSSGGKNQTLPLVSLGLGILGVVLFCCYGGIPFGIGALVTGFLGFQNANNDPENYGGSGLAIGGMALGGLGLFITIILVLAVMIR